MKAKSWVVGAVGVCVIALLLSGCGGASREDVNNARNQIQAQISSLSQQISRGTVPSPTPSNPVPPPPTSPLPPTSTTSTSQIGIVDPPNHSRVKSQIVVETTRLPSGMEVWIVVYARDAPRPRYYPQGGYPDYGPVIPTGQGKWVSPDVFIGNEKDAGKHFDILAVSVDTQARNVFWQYLKAGKPTPPSTNGNFPGLPVLPAGATEVARVQVVRL